MIPITGATGRASPAQRRQRLGAEDGGMGLVLRAARFAAWKHRDQRRKGHRSLPYVNHPIDLANVLWFEGDVRDPVTLAAALLHDTIEDTQTTVQELQGEFGAEVAQIVLEVTDEPSLHYRVRRKLQVTRARSASPAARHVKLADKICNLRDLIASPPASWSIERVREYFDWARAVVAEMRGTNPELEGRFDQAYRRRP